MHSVEMIESAIEVAERLGYEIRQEWLGGATGGCCELRGAKWLFLDLSLPAEDRLAQLADVLAQDSRIGKEASLPAELQRYLKRRAAGV